MNAKTNVLFSSSKPLTDATSAAATIKQEEMLPAARFQRYFDTDRPEDTLAMCNLSVLQLAQLYS